MSNIINLCENNLAENNEILGKYMYYSIPGVLIMKSNIDDLIKNNKVPIEINTRSACVYAFKEAAKKTHDKRTEQVNGKVKIISKLYFKPSLGIDGTYSSSLIKETIGRKYKCVKLAEMRLNKVKSTLEYTIDSFDKDYDVKFYCQNCSTLFNHYNDYINKSQIDSILENALNEMNAMKIPINGKLFFVPKNKLNELNELEKFIERLNDYNLGKKNCLFVNSFYALNEDKQKARLKKEYISIHIKEIESCCERINYFLHSNCASSLVMSRWVSKAQDFNQRIKEYKFVLQDNLERLNPYYEKLNHFINQLSLRIVDTEKKAS